jgi:RNAse (barnase) inhibitor barstar
MMMSKINLTDPKQNGVYSLDRAEVCVVDVSGAKTKKDLLECCAKGLHLPAHFGKNWDALADCLLDEEWAVAPGYLVVVRGARAAAKACGEDFATMQEIFEDAADTWKEDGKAFSVFLG